MRTPVAKLQILHRREGEQVYVWQFCDLCLRRSQTLQDAVSCTLLLAHVASSLETHWFLLFNLFPDYKGSQTPQLRRPERHLGFHQSSWAYETALQPSASFDHPQYGGSSFSHSKHLMNQMHPRSRNLRADRASTWSQTLRFCRSYETCNMGRLLKKALLM